MKRILTVGLIAFLISCGGDNRNELMTKLVNEKKVLQDSMAIVHGIERIFADSASSLASAGKDSTIYLPVLDSSFKYSNSGHAMKLRLEEIDFSIDSLSKMK